jgi:outer membrane protein assembly factor BamB
MKKQIFFLFLLMSILFFSFPCLSPIAIEKQNDPTIKWTFPLDILSNQQIVGDIALDKNNNIYISSTGILGSGNAKLTAINPNGIQKWTFPVRNFSISNPIIDQKGRIIVHSSPSLYALNSNGLLLWEMEDFPNLCQLSLGSNGIIYGSDCSIGAYTRKIWSIDSSGLINWSIPFETNTKITLDNNNNLLLFHRNRITKESYLVCINGNDRSILWKYFLKDEITESTGIAISPDFLLIINLKKSLIALDQKGIVKWEKAPFISKKIPIIDQNGIIYVADENEKSFLALFPDGTIKWKKDGINVLPSFITENGFIHYFEFLNQEEIYLHSIDQDGLDQWKIPVNLIRPSPAIMKDGTIFMILNDHLVAIRGNSSLSKKGWPIANHDNQNTNCFTTIEEPDKIPKKIMIEMSIDSTIANVNGFPQKIDPPFINQNKTYVPFRFLGEFLGLDVEFTINPETKLVDTVSYENKNKCVTLFVDQYEIMINGEHSLLDAPPIIRNHRAYIPVRFVSETIGATVQWNSKTQSITIIYED